MKIKWEVFELKYLPSNLIVRKQQLQEILNVLLPALTGKSKNVIIIGKPGTGRTLLAKKVLGELEREAKKKKILFFTIYINCRIVTHAYNIVLEILGSLQRFMLKEKPAPIGFIPRRGVSIDKLLFVFNSIVEKNVPVVVLFLIILIFYFQ